MIKDFAIVIDNVTKMRLKQKGQLFVFGTDATTFFNQSSALACFSQFQSSRAGCFIGTESYSPFVIKDSAGTTTLLQINSSLNVQAPNSIITSTGQFQGQAWTTTTPADGDPKIRMNPSPQQIEMEAGNNDLLIIHPSYVKSFVDIQTVGIAGRVTPSADARIDLGASFVVSKGDGTERFSINAQSGAIKQTASAYTAIVIESSNATGALIKSSCGGGTYSFGASNLGWIVLDETLDVLCQIDNEAASFNVQIQTDSITTKDAAEGDAAITLGSSVVRVEFETTVIEVSGDYKSVGINGAATDKAGLTVNTAVGNPTYGTQGVWSRGSVSPTTQAGRFFDSYLSQPIIAAASSCEVNHFRAYDNATGTTTGSHAGFVAGNLKAGTTKNYGFWSQIADVAGKTNYAFYASSTAPSYLKGGLLVPSVRGPEDTNAVIALSEQATLKKGDGSAYVCTTASSLATKEYVDSVAGSGGGASIEAGTPASAGAAGSPGDMMFDENYLWLRTATEWKKIPLTAYAGTAAAATIQVTQSQYDGLAVKDPNTLYVIVG